ncbi:MAG: Na+/H+ antiporter NhaA [Caulobacteraceae bacterium]|nr:Na+/H+ antiporter NhaA [Caulobacteraceae bacterium]
MALRPTLDFLKTEAAGGAVLAVAALIGFILANSPLSHAYFQAIGSDFTIQLGGFSETLTVQDWIKEGLMAVFFFVVGLEIKQEVLKGELSSPRKLALPVAAAAGGMIAPALIYLAFNLRSGGTPHGWAIPTATDIAFALAALAMVGRGLPQSLRIFLLAMAIADDLGAVALIAVLFTSQIHAWYLLGAALALVGLIALSEWKEAPFLFRAVGFLVLGAFTLKSGINTSLAGVAGALTVPVAPRRPGQEGVLKNFLRTLHPYVAFGVLPLFALTAAGVSLSSVDPRQMLTPAPLGIAAGLLIGKQVGVLGAVWIAIRSGLARRPTGATWLELYGVAALCGVGFTMSLFIADLTFPRHGPGGPEATLAIVIGSLASAAFGAGVLAVAAARRRRLRSAADEDEI